MEIQEYQKQVLRTFPNLGNTEKDILHMLLGLSTEIGELHDIYKKSLAYGKNIDLPHVNEEVGDIMWYIANLCNILEFDLSNVLQINIDKLKVRYPKKFEESKALNRDIDKENKVLGKE